MNAYTYTTRNEILANMHTANMSKLGINLAFGNWKIAIGFFIPIVACALGAAFSEYVEYLIQKSKYKGNWRKLALLIESIGLFSIGLIPLSVFDFIVTNFVSFWMGYQLCLFRKCLGIGYSTTICTGNIRTLGQFLYDALEEENTFYTIKLITFTVLTFSFAMGAALGTIISTAISIKAVWIPSIVLLTQILWIHICDIIN